MEKNTKIISHHTFMLPFTYECKDEEIVDDNWEYKKYNDNYNELAFFHTFFLESMFYKKSNSSFYKYKNYKNSEFIISKSKDYTLNLKSINLRLFSTGVGVLSFHIENKEYKDIKDILEINDYGRRIYPEFLDEGLQCLLTPNYIHIKDKDKNIEIKEDFIYNKRPKEIQYSALITKILPKEKIKTAVDDRMFVISFYKNSMLSHDLKRDYIKNDRWYEYVYIDGAGKTVQNEKMQTELIKNATYPRWQNYGTMYGISKYSFTCLTEDSDFAEKNIEVHMQTIYFQMFSLLLMIRATILKFSNEISVISKEIDKDSSVNKVSDLYKRYIQFVNSFYFREITAKDQGLEIYEKAVAILNIERDIKDLDAEIEELHKYVEIQSDKATASSMNMLTWVGGILLPPTIVTSYFGMNYLDGLGKFLPNFALNNKGITSTVLVVLSTMIIPLFLWMKERKKNE